MRIMNVNNKDNNYMIIVGESWLDVTNIRMIY